MRGSISSPIGSSAALDLYEWYTNRRDHPNNGEAPTRANPIDYQLQNC